jgi:TonB-linked SusC/RagA family outer membrane protein
MWLICGVVIPAFSSGQRQLALQKTRQSDVLFQQRQTSQVTLNTLLRDLEKKHRVSFICRSELLSLKIDVDPEALEGRQFLSRLEKLLANHALLVKKISRQQFAISAQSENQEAVFPADQKTTSTADVSVNFTGVTSPNALHAATPRAFTVSGTVTSAASNAPMQGVSVLMKGSADGTTTDANGNFSLSIPAESAVLVFSYIGFQTLERVVNREERLSIIMQEDARSLEQVVVVGYGTQKKVNLTGAISAVSAEDFRGRPITATSSGLQGLMPGVTIRNTTALPGQNGSSIRIRGIGTLGDANPLVVIDGIPGGDMNIINPDDIESISVLKDAASSSIYGVRGANGVILITTKKGKAGAQQSLSYNNYYGFQTPTALPEFLGSPEYMTLLNESQKNVGRTITYTDAEIEKARNGSDPNYYANTNWLKEIYKKRAAQNNHNISLNGGANNLSYYVSYGYLSQDGLVTGDNYGAKRNNLRLRLNTKLLNRLDLDFNIGYVDRKYSESSEDIGESAGPLYSAHQISPLVPVRFTTGGWGYLGGSRNPVAVTTAGGYNNFASQEVTGNLSAALNLFDGFRLRAQYGLIRSNSKREILWKTIDYFSPVTGDRIYQTNFPNKIDNRDYTNTYQTVIGMAEYEKTFNNIHDIKILVGASQESNVSESFTASRTNLVSQEVDNINLGTLNQLNSGNDAQTALQSLFGRANYVLNNKYLAELNFRYDGSSRFARDVRWNLFPSASVGWRLSEEGFFSGLKNVFREVKLRASYGELGNDKVGNDYAYLSTIVPVTTMPIGNVLTAAYAQTRLPNQILTWETVIKKNIGIDLAMARGRLGITADYFIHNTDDILLTVTLPDVLGATEPSQNAGKVENRGWELQLDWKDNIGQFRYGFNFNLSDVKNQVVSLGNVPPTFGDQVRFLGEPIDAFYGLVAERIAQVSDFDFNATTNVYTPKFPVIAGDRVAPGDVIYRDLTKDGRITLADDRQIIGNPFPRYSYGFRTDVGWKGFDFNFFVQGVGKADGYIKGAGRHAYINESANPQKIHLDRWTPENTDASYPRFTYQLSHNQRFSTMWLEDASYLRLKNVQLGYTLPLRLTEKLRISRLRFFASADNLFTKSDFFYAYDPETPVSSGGYYPQVKTFIFGLNLNLK